MNTRVIGFVPPDDKWRKMADVWFACEKAGVDVPHDVEMFFDEGAPDPHGQEVDLPHTQWQPQDKGWPAWGIEVEVAKIPAKVKFIRFYNCR